MYIFLKYTKDKVCKFEVNTKINYHSWWRLAEGSLSAGSFECLREPEGRQGDASRRVLEDPKNGSRRTGTGLGSTRGIRHCGCQIYTCCWQLQKTSSLVSPFLHTRGWVRGCESGEVPGISQVRKSRTRW